MSIEANTYEELYIKNVNEKTARICDSVGIYLTSTWGIIKLLLTVDGKEYHCEDDRIGQDTELFSVCKKLAGSKEIRMAMRSSNGGGLLWRMESGFMKLFTDDAEVKENVVYRSTDYYDSDTGVDKYRYDINGLQAIQYNASAESIADIKRWYCYTPNIRICDEEDSDNAKLYKKIIGIMRKLGKLFGFEEDELEDRIDDGWEDYGEIVVEGSISFTTKQIPKIVEAANQLAKLLQDSESAEFEFEIYAVPDGEKDYDFASVAIELCDDAVKDSYARF